MSEFIRKVKRRIEVFDIEHGGFISRYKIFIAIMSAALTIALITVIVAGIVTFSSKDSEEEPSDGAMVFRTRWPDEDVILDNEGSGLEQPVITTMPPTATPTVVPTPLPPRTPMPVPTVTPTPDPIVEDLEKPEDVEVNDSVMQESDKKDDGQNNSNKGNGGNVSNIKPENNDKYVNNATNNTYTDNGFYVKDGFKYYAKNGKTVSRVGIDVSIYQGNVDWKKVKASGVDFVMIRLGFRGYVTGKLVLDSNFKKNIEGALDAGLDVGVYFFSQAITTKEAVEEAAMCIKYLRPYKNRITYPVAIDTEYVNSASARTNKPNITNKIRTDVCIAFCETVKNEGYKPMVYANKNWLLQNLQLSRLNNYDIWYARYGTNTPDYDYSFTIWQYTGNGRVDGIVGAVDLNVGLKDYSNKGGNDIGEGVPQDSEAPQGSDTPEGTKVPEETKEPIGSEPPKTSEEPIGSETPVGSETPQGSEIPQGSETPQGSESPLGSESPMESDTPQGSESPTGSDTPEGSESPTGSDTPIGSETPTESEAPTNSEAPEPSKNPEEDDKDDEILPSPSPSPVVE